MSMAIDTCPACKSDLRGGKIPQEYIDQGYYPLSVTHYSRLLGIEVPGEYDGVLIWNCPDCGHYWPRFDSGYKHTHALEIIGGWNV